MQVVVPPKDPAVKIHRRVGHGQYAHGLQSAVGRFAESDDRPWWMFAVLAAVAAPLAVLAGAVLGGLLGDPRVRWDEVIGLMVSAAAYALVLGLLLTLPLRRLCRWVVPEAYSR